MKLLFRHKCDLGDNLLFIFKYYKILKNLKWPTPLVLKHSTQRIPNLYELKSTLLPSLHLTTSTVLFTKGKMIKFAAQLRD